MGVKEGFTIWFCELSSLSLPVYYLNLFEINLFKNQNHKTPAVKWPQLAQPAHTLHVYCVQFLCQFLN